uniref:Beta-carotene isomerase D27-like C-terminal domain-containing protein n=2 Tax=Lotharella globosa TaxID=91324 RepID=A0A7S4DMS4_9EUKA
MFARPLPKLSGRMIAFVTAQTCEWLMGQCTVTSANVTGPPTDVDGLGVRVERCRYLEETGCASVCINCCKEPTQRFFKEDMGVDVRMTPNYDDFSCQFDFLQAPLDPSEDPAFNVACFAQCPSQKRSSKGNCEGTTTD